MKYRGFSGTLSGKGRMLYRLLNNHSREDSPVYKFVDDSERILYDVSAGKFQQVPWRPEKFLFLLKKQVPGKISFLNRLKPKLAIVTCGGLCPGLNNVIRSLVNELYYRYGISPYPRD